MKSKIFVKANPNDRDKNGNLQKVLDNIEEIIKKAKSKDLEEINKKKELLNKRKIEIEEQEEELNTQKQEIEQSKKNIKRKEDEIKKNQEEIYKKNEEFKEKEKDLIDMKTKLEELKIQLEKEKDKNKIIEKEKLNLEEKNEKLEKKIKFIHNQLSGGLSNIEEKSEIKSPSLIGLNNIGGASYINATLQCFIQTEELTNFFLEERNKDQIINNNIALNNKNDNQISLAYFELIQNLNKNEIKSYSPNNFIGTIEKMNPLFKRGQAGDVKDFIIFILEQIHKELKKSNKNKEQSSEILNQYDRNSAFNHFLEGLKSENSIIKEQFFGIYEDTNVCLNCQNHYNSKKLNSPIYYN